MPMKPSDYYISDPAVFGGFNREADDDLHAPNSRDVEMGSIISRRGASHPFVTAFSHYTDAYN